MTRDLRLTTCDLRLATRNLQTVWGWEVGLPLTDLLSFVLSSTYLIANLSLHTNVEYNNDDDDDLSSVLLAVLAFDLYALSLVVVAGST